MAENYKHLYEQTKKMLTMYQDELIPGFRKTIAKLEAKSKWIPVTERLPDKMGRYICQYVFGEETKYPFFQVLWYYATLEEPHFQHEGCMGLRVTHWMPLPEAPKGE